MSDSQKMTHAIQALEEAVASVPVAEIPALLGTLERVKALGWGRMFTGSQHGQGEEDLLTVPEVAKRLKVSEYRVYELVRQGKIKRTSLGDTSKKGTSVRVKPSDLAAYLAQQGG